MSWQRWRQSVATAWRQQWQSLKYTKNELAKMKAVKLLLSNLTTQQMETYINKGYFCVRGSGGGEYIINTRRPYANISRITFEHEYRRDVYCINIQNYFECPYEDNVLAQKLVIEGDEKTFLKIANCWQA